MLLNVDLLFSVEHRLLTSVFLPALLL